jgi:hypothetical protein
MHGGGEGGPIFQPIEVNAAKAVERVDFLGSKLDGHHQASVALTLAVAALASGVGGRALKHRLG